MFQLHLCENLYVPVKITIQVLKKNLNLTDCLHILQASELVSALHTLKNVTESDQNCTF